MGSFFALFAFSRGQVVFGCPFAFLRGSKRRPAVVASGIGPRPSEGTRISMTTKRLSNFTFRLLLVAGAVALIGGTAWLAARLADRRLRADLLQQALLVVNALDPQRVAALSGTEADLASPDYLRLKELLGDITTANAQCRFACLMGKMATGPVFFYVDSEPADSPDYSPPGQTYEEASAVLLGLFASGQAGVEGPEKDRWGTWVTVFVPLSMPATHAAPILLGMDFDAAIWRKEIALRAALPILLAVVTTLFGLLSALLHQSRRKAREGETDRAALMEKMINAFVIFDPVFDRHGEFISYRFVDINEAYEHITGVQRDAVRGKTVHEVWPGTEPSWIQAYGEVSRTGVAREFDMYHEPTRKLYHCQVYRPNASSSRFCVIFEDITARRTDEDQVRSHLEESNQSRQALLGILEDQSKAEADLKRLATAIDQAAEMIVVTDPQGLIQYVNPAFEAVTGYTRAEAIGQNPRIFQSGRHDKAFYLQLWETLTSHKTWKGRFINKRKDGSLYTEDAIISPVCDPQGHIVNYVAVKHNITEQLRLSMRLQQAQRMESVGRLAGGVAHDFNNMLTVILGRSEMALEHSDPDLPVTTDLKEIRDAAVRAADLTRQLLAFARRQTIAPKTLGLNQADRRHASDAAAADRRTYPPRLATGPAALAGQDGPLSNRPDPRQPVCQRPGCHRPHRQDQHRNGKLRL